MATLRSSRAALLEHIKGTAWALQYSQVSGFAKAHSGNAIQGLMDLAGRPPENRLSIPLPDWLSDPAAHKEACEEEEEEALYIAIGKLTLQMSEGRELAKARHLSALLGNHDLVLAFDSRPITLARIRRELEARGVDVLLATGNDARGKAAIREAFERGSLRKNIIGLCSDSMAEGINLQRASCMVHLDMPSVVRIAEQRVGRVDRMDSPHAVIEAWWPRDAEEFALRTDERFIERYETVEALLGSNLPLPPDMQGRTQPSQVVDPLRLAEELEREGQEHGWDGLEDAFTPVRNLVEGQAAMVPPATYAHYRTVTARVLSRVSLVRTHAEWAFFCLRGSAQGAPKWIAFPAPTQAPVTELGEVCGLLRERLGPDAVSGDADARAMGVLAHFLGRLQDAEKLLLPRRKQRALVEMGYVLGQYRLDASRRKDPDAFDFLDRLLTMIEKPEPDQLPDWDDVAERWLDLIRPVWFELLSRRGRHRPLLLEDLRTSLLGPGRLGLEAIQAAFDALRAGTPLDERVAACVIGVLSE